MIKKASSAGSRRRGPAPVTAAALAAGVHPPVLDDAEVKPLRPAPSGGAATGTAAPADTVNSPAVGRCRAAHVADPRPCEGRPDAVRVSDHSGTAVEACVLHGAVLLASLQSGRVELLHGAPATAIDVHRRSRALPPFDFLRGPGVVRVTTVEDAASFPSAPGSREDA